MAGQLTEVQLIGVKSNKSCLPATEVKQIYRTRFYQSLFTKADTLAELPIKERDTVRCHFEKGKGAKVVLLHNVREKVIAV